MRQGPYVHEVLVRALSARRGPAAVAKELYEETAESLAAREKVAERLKSAPPPMFYDGGRPTKRDRRAIEKFRNRQD